MTERQWEHFRYLKKSTTPDSSQGAFKKPRFHAKLFLKFRVVPLKQILGILTPVKCVHNILRIDTNTGMGAQSHPAALASHH